VTLPIADKDVLKRIFIKFEEDDLKDALREKDYPWMTITD
jgi:hypothetical protein